MGLTVGGFEAPGTGNLLDFTGTPYEGLEVTVDAASMAVMLSVTELFAAASERTSQESVTAMRDLLGMFAQVLESWNTEDRKTGDPVPATLEGLLSQDSDFVLAIIGAWLTGTLQADDDLGKDLPSGETSAEELIPMEPLSESPPSSSPPRLLSGCVTAGRRRRTRFSRWTAVRCACWTSTTGATGTRREVRTDGRQLRIDTHQG